MINLKNTILGTAVILAASLQISAAANYYGFDESGTGTFSGTVAGGGATKILTKFGAGELTVAPSSGGFGGYQVISGKVTSATVPATIHFTATQPSDFKSYAPTGGTAGTGTFNYTGNDIPVTGTAAAINVDGGNTSATLTSTANMKISLTALAGTFTASAPSKAFTLSQALPTAGTIYVGQASDATGTTLKLSAQAALGAGGTISLVGKGSVLDSTSDTPATTGSGATPAIIALAPASGTAYGVTMASGTVWKLTAGINYSSVAITLQ